MSVVPDQLKEPLENYCAREIIGRDQANKRLYNFRDWYEKTKASYEASSKKR